MFWCSTKKRKVIFEMNIILSKECYEDCPGRTKCSEDGAYRGIIIAAPLNNLNLVSIIFFPPFDNR